MNKQTKEEFKEHAASAAAAISGVAHQVRTNVIVSLMELAYLRGQKDALKEDNEKLRNVIDNITLPTST